MKIKRDFSETIYFLIFGTVYSVSILLSVFKATIFEVETTLIISLALISIVVAYIISYNKITGVFGLFLLIGLGVFILMLFFNDPVYSPDMSKFDELSLFVNRRIPYQESFKLPLVTSIVFLVTLMTGFCLKIKHNIYILTPLGIIIFAVPAFFKYKQSELGMVLFVLCFFIMLIKELNLFTLKGAKKRVKKNNAVTFSLLPIGLLAVLVSYYAPKPDIEKNALDYIRDNYMTASVFSFSETKRLGGPLFWNNNFVVEVTPESRSYLIHSVKDTYTGDSWLGYSGKEKAIDKISGMYNISYYSSYIENRIQGMIIDYGSVKTKTVNTREKRYNKIFAPAFSYQAYLETDKTLYMNDFGTIRLDSSLPRETEYKLSYYVWNRSNSELEDIWRRQSNESNRAYDDESLLSYTGLPDDLPQRIYDLAEEITKYCSNYYDMAKAIENYLKRFPYTTTPYNVPDDVDFVDYFLFEGQEGYCVYYATAFAVLGRCLGIPTRYVEGFVMPDGLNENGNYTVTNRQAHAWAEIYIPNFGWLQFEPTAGYNEAFYSSGGTVYPVTSDDMSESSGIGSENESFGESSEETSIDEPSQYDESVDHPDESQEDPSSVPPGESQSGESEALPPGVISGTSGSSGGTNAAGSIKNNIIIMVSGFAVLILLCLLSRIIYTSAVYRKREQKLRMMNNRAASLVYYKHILSMAGNLGCPIRDDETAFSWTIRVQGQPDLRDIGGQLKSASEVFIEARYSKNDIGNENFEKIKDCHDKINEVTKNKMNKLKYFINKYIFMKF